MLLLLFFFFFAVRGVGDLLGVVTLGKGVLYAFGFVVYKGVEAHIVNAREDAFLYGGICLFKVLYEGLYFLSFRFADAVF